MSTRSSSRGRAVLLGLPVVLVFLSGTALAASPWAATGSGTGAVASNHLAAPSAGNANTVTASSVTVAVTTKPSTGPTPTAYRVDRTSSAAPGAATAVCVITATNGLGSCTDNSAGLTPNTTYTYAVFSKIGASWTSGSSLAVSGTTAAPSDSTPPTLTQNCPTTGHAAYLTGNNGSSSWHGICGDAAKMNATDDVGVASAAIKISKSGSTTTCWNGTAFTAAQCTASGPSGYPAGYLAATHGSGNVWSVSIGNSGLGANGTFTFAGQAKDAAGNTSATLTVSFTTS